jgi:hypothetical protein
MIDIERAEGSRPFVSGLGVARPRSEPRPFFLSFSVCFPAVPRSTRAVRRAACLQAATADDYSQPGARVPPHRGIGPGLLTAAAAVGIDS